MASSGVRRCTFMSQNWKKLSVPREELELNTVLICGQSFRWRKTNHENDVTTGAGSNLESNTTTEWTGVFDQRVWILKQIENEIFYKVFQKSSTEENVLNSTDSDNEKHLKDYFQLNVLVNALYTEWCSKDPKFASLTKKDYQGIRILQQNPIETIFTFICSSNNNISRITQMVDKLCRYYGNPIIELNGQIYYDFPQVEKMQEEKVEAKLKEEKFGYRARFIVKCSKKIVKNGGLDWVNKLKKIGYEDARKELQTLDGVGRKVADCICLMSLGYHEAIPIDTHIHQVAKQYLPHLAKIKTLTDKVYIEIRDYFHNIYGDYAGWAQSVLFTSTLRNLKTPAKEGTKKPKTSKSSDLCLKNDIDRLDDKERDGTAEEAKQGESKSLARKIKRARK